MIHKDITLILGPTAVGKSKYAVELAKETGAEIISADAYQIYKKLDIGTAKTTPEEQDGIPHHLIDIKDATESYTVSDFLNNTETIIKALREKNTPIIICGGTGLYVQTFLYGYSLAPQNPEIRKQLEIEAEATTKLKTWEKLKKIDPVSADAIPYQNLRRVIRALEIHTITQEAPSSFTQRKTCRDDVTIIGLTADKEILHKRIHERVDIMVEQGLIEEVKRLLASGVPKHAQAFKAIGYKEVIEYLESTIDKETMISTIKAHTRQCAKRQMTWFKKIKNIDWKLT